MRALTVVLIFTVCAAAAAFQAPTPPSTRAQDVVEIIHGTSVRDPYRWLEDQDAPETRAWLAAQTKYTRSLLDAMPGRGDVRRLIEDVERRERVSAPFATDGRRFFFARSGAGDAGSSYYARTSDGADQLELPAPADADGRPLGLQFQALSRDGRLLAYGTRRGGADQTEIAFLDLRTNRHLRDRLPLATYRDMFLLPDNSGVFYARRLRTGTRLLFHKFGDDAAGDRELFGAGRDDSWISRFSYSPDGRFIVVFVSKGSGTLAPTQVFLRDRSGNAPFREVLKEATGASFQGGFGGDKLYLKTTWNAPNGRVISLDPAHPDRPWRDVVPPSTRRVILSMHLAGGALVLLTMEEVRNQLQVVDVRTKQVRMISLPTLGMISAVTTYGWHRPAVFFTFSSLADPVVYRYDVTTKRRTVWSGSSKPNHASDIETEQVWYASKDGTRVPMFVIRRKGTILDGNVPTLLSGYGGYGAISLPFLSTDAAVWVRAGGVYAFATIRGGGELGVDWHRAGQRDQKQNSFDDFIAAAEWLIDQKYTRPERLALIGGSNGGMLVAVAAVQRPELFRAVVSRAPHLDMIRYHKFLAAAPWVAEFGSPDVKEEFDYLYRYSPYHRVQDGIAYPAMMFVTGDSDTRVAPLHARKMTARMQAASTSGRPILLRYDALTGHSGSSIPDNIQRLTDELSFLFTELGLGTAGSRASPSHRR